MTASKGREPVYCPRVRWDGERVDLRFPTHGAAECRAVGRGVEAHACRRRAGHEEDQVVHVCYCGLAWSADGDDAGADGTVGILAGPSRVGTDTAPEGTSSRA